MPNAARAQSREWTPTPDEPGRFDARPRMADIGGFDSPTARRAAIALADRVLDVLRRSAYIQQPVGYDATLWRRAGQNLDGAAAGAPYYAGAGSDAWTLYRHVANGTATREATGRMKVYVLVNALTCGSDDRLPAELDGGPRVLSTMRNTGTFRGHPVYDGTCVVLTHRPGAPVVPVTRERWLRLHTEYFRRQLAKAGEARAQLVQMHASVGDFDADVARLRQHVQDLDAQLAAMSPAERAAPAWVHESHGDTALVAPGTPDAVPLQQVNTAFVDRSLPNDAPQSIAVVISDGILESTWQHDDDRAFRWQIAQRVRDNIDWAALEAMLRP